MKKIFFFIFLVLCLVSCEKEKDANIPYTLVYTEETNYGTFEYKIDFMGSENCSYDYLESMDKNSMRMNHIITVHRIQTIWPWYNLNVVSMHPLHSIRLEKSETEPFKQEE